MEEKKRVLFTEEMRKDYTILVPTMLPMHFRFIIKQDHGNIRFAFFFLLLCNHSVEATDGVALKSGHRTATIQNKYQLCQIVFRFHFYYLR